MNMTLEKEFGQRKIAHIWAVLRAKMVRYYEVTLAGTVQLPVFMGGETPETCADRDLERLFNEDFDRFMELYEEAYQEFAKVGDF